MKSTSYVFKIDAAKSIDDNFDEFLRITQLLVGTKHAIYHTSQVMILMNVLPDNYHAVKDAFQYTGMVPSLEIFCNAFRTRENEINYAT